MPDDAPSKVIGISLKISGNRIFSRFDQIMFFQQANLLPLSDLQNLSRPPTSPKLVGPGFEEISLSDDQRPIGGMCNYLSSMAHGR